jgi:hypothetical protein
VALGGSPQPKGAGGHRCGFARIESIADSEANAAKNRATQPRTQQRESLRRTWKSTDDDDAARCCTHQVVGMQRPNTPFG